MKTIIIPFSESTNLYGLTEAVVSVVGNGNIHCIFLAIKALPDNYNDLFFLSKSPFETEKASNTFYHFAAASKKLYGERVTVTADYIYGDSDPAFRHYAQHKNVDMVVFDTAQWDLTNKRKRTGIFKMLCRSGCELLYVFPTNTFVKSLPQLDTKENFWKNEPELATAPVLQTAGDKRTAKLPKTVIYQYSAVNDMLNEWENQVTGKHVFSTTMSTMSRYFLKEQAVQKMLERSGCVYMVLK
ncbi:hypothetical protein [Pinibacter aurantiacus]|uniref:Universal stress protein n=1 Tax=Pinibacter aurantiacus TaxID=2851599 RepID=A0A9E2SD23_9BACT|nr:hypothetical protein [Pinibacter aurantiacus]MBV4358250.1 hypothetical protein [Pinibacter aurantiacus]